MQYPPAFPGFNTALPQARSPRKPTSRAAWPLIVVIVLAAGIGVVVVWLSMRTNHGRAPDDAMGASGSASVPVASAELSDASNTPQTVPPAAVGLDASDGSKKNELSPGDHAAPATTVSIDAPADAPVDAPADAPADAPVDAPADAPVDALAVPSNARSSEAATPPTHAPGDPSRPTHAPTDASGPRTPGTAAPSVSDLSLPEPTPSQPSPGSAAPPPPPTRKPKTAAPTFDSLHVLYEKDDYAGVVHACSATTVTAVIANICTLAACHAHDSTKAQRWLSINPAAARDRLASFCKQLGTNVKVPGSD